MCFTSVLDDCYVQPLTLWGCFHIHGWKYKIPLCTSGITNSSEADPVPAIRCYAFSMRWKASNSKSREDSRGGHSTLRASRSLSKLCPMRMVSALNILSSTAWTSRRLMVVFSKSSCVTPENLWRIHTAFMITVYPGLPWVNWQQAPPPRVKSHKANSPRVVIYHFAFRFDERIVDDFHLRVDDRHPGQFQAMLCVTLIHTREKKD